MVLGAVGLVVGIGWATTGALPVDADFLWRARLDDLYGTTWTLDDRWVYPPPLAVALQPVHAIGWQAFVVCWTVLLFLALWVSTREWSIPVLIVGSIGLLVPALWFLGSPVVYPVIGNIQPFVAAAIVVGMRWPAAWAFVFLTKIGPGVGILWFAFRREWSKVAGAVVATGLVAAVSVVLAPGAWTDFVRFALTNATIAPPISVVPIPWLIRVAMSVALLAWGARTDRMWTVPIAAGWAAIALYDWTFLSIWVAALPLASRSSERHRPESL